MRLETVLLAHCRNHPERDALVCGERRVTYGELAPRLRALAAGLAASGIGAGDRVVLYLPNSIEFVEAFFAVLAAGGIAIPVTTRLTLRELSYFCDDSAAKMLICHADQAADIAAQVLPDRPGLAVRVTGDASGGGLPAFDTLRRPDAPPPAPAAADLDEAAILYTSGTTGRPKGVVLTHANILIQHGFMNGVEWGITGRDRYLVVAPMAHRAGMGRMINATMLGGTLYIMAQFDPETLLATIERERITVLGLVPTMCRILLPSLATAPGRAASLRRLAVTGEAFPVALKQRLIALLPDMQLVSFFGMTEAGGVTTLQHREQFTHADSVGRPSAGVEVRIVGEDGRDMAADGIGELWVRTGRPGAFTVMKSYFNRPEQTAAALQDGWFRTGDMARQDADGYLYIVDRKKDMILSGGFNIYSKEVEQAIADLPGIRDVAVIGVPDELYGETVVAVVEHDPEHPAPDAATVIGHCRAAIASYKKPRHVFHRPSLPRNAVGKVLKHVLVREITAELAARAQGAA